MIASIMQKRDDAPGDPMSDEMKEARRATFAGRWPHDGKKGWACSTEKVSRHDRRPSESMPEI
jgi:2-keto-3-deoxy-L-rhamnonate aldolase RhmA